MSGKLIITHGLPGSGKSTWAEKEVEKDPKNVIRVNRDDIRTTLFGEKYHKGSPDPKKESQVTQVQDKLIRDGLRAGKTVISDDTNLNPRFLPNLIKKARENGSEIQQVAFDIPIEVAKERNRKRGESGGRLVPEFVIENMAKSAYTNGTLNDFVLGETTAFSIPKITDGRQKIHDFNKSLEQKNPFKGKAIVLVDVDGTLASNARESDIAFGNPDKKRNYPYFFRSIENSKVNKKVLDLANAMRDNDDLNIVVLTGRDDQYAQELINFIDKSGIKASKLIAKRSGDFRKDYEFKKEELDKLKDEGFVFVHSIDDREGSVRMYESMGIMVSRVNEHTPGVVKDKEFYKEPELNTIYGSGYCIRCGKPLKNGGNIGPECRRK